MTLIKNLYSSILLSVAILGVHHCIILVAAAGGSPCPPLKKLDVLPGRGWDNLRNKEMSQLQAMTYTECKTTPDGLYLIPDEVFIIPVKQSDVQYISSLIHNWKNFSSSTSKSINVNADASFGSSFSISASFSEEYQTMKNQQVDLKSVTTRVQARYVLYTVTTPDTARLNQHPMYMLHQALDAIKTNDDNTLEYILDLFVREYGTHKLSRVDAGALILQDEYISRDYADSLSGSSQVIKIAASAKFFSHFGISGSYITTVNQSVGTGYEDSLRSSKTSSIGGVLLHPRNVSIDDWVDSIPENLVAIDREGDPIHFLITPSIFPDESLEVVDKLRLQVQQAIGRYYIYNKHIGCMQVGSPNFDYNANIDNNICRDPHNNYTFSGVYQTCQATGHDDPKEKAMCAQKIRKNYLTQDVSCPQNYSSVPLKTSVERVHFCLWWIFGCYWPTVTYTTYWCAAVEGTVPENTGLMFGGLFTSKLDNPTTQGKSCPATFTSVQVIDDLNICVGEDYELGHRFSTDFGGFFSCQKGNPLYKAVLNLKRHRLLDFPDLNNETTRACPSGFTQHTAIIHQDCLVSYCVKAGSFSLHGDMPVILPPFKNYTGPTEGTNSGSYNNRAGGGLTVTITLSVLVTLLIFTVIGLIAYNIWIRKRRVIPYQTLQGGEAGPEGAPADQDANSCLE